MDEKPIRKRKAKKLPWVKQVSGKPTVKAHKPNEKKEEGQD